MSTVAVAVGRVRLPAAARAGRWLVTVAVMAAAVAIALPAVSGAPWPAIGRTLVTVEPAALVALVALWATGLLIHTLVLTAALPGLSHRRALTLSLTGSAVANVLPVGGAAGVALNYRMTRAWGYEGRDFTTYTVVTNACNVLVKLALPVLAMPLLVLADVPLGRLFTPIAVAVGVVGAFCGLAAWTLGSPRIAGRVGALADRVARPVLRRVGSPHEPGLGRALLEVQSASGHAVRNQWRRLALGATGYLGLLYLLLWGCLAATGSHLAPAVVLAGFMVERLLTLVNLTPGGAGLVELGLAGTLLALGGDPVGVTAGVLLYRALTFGLEIPVGGVWVAGWFWSRR